MDEILYLNPEDSQYINYLLAIRDSVFESEMSSNLSYNYLKLFEEVSTKYPMI